MLSLDNFVLCVAVFLSAVHSLAAHFEHKENAKLLLISFDGFRWDYLQRAGRERTPNFHSIIDSGVHPKWVKDAFITRTFPNHFTLVTGLYEETHGVVGNRMFDRKLNETFVHTPGQMTEAKWWDSGVGALPIWTANQIGGNGRKSGVVFWPGSLVQFSNVLPYQSLGQFNASTRFEDIIDIMIKWYKDEHSPINFGAIYFSQPDHLGHMVGPNDPKISDLVAQLDRDVVGRLLEKVKADEDLNEDLNIIITSDHGMTEVTEDRVIQVDKYMDTNLFTAYTNAPVWQIIPNPGELD